MVPCGLPKVLADAVILNRFEHLELQKLIQFQLNWRLIESDLKVFELI